MPASILDGFCNIMASKRASFGGFIGKGLGSPEGYSVVTDDADESKSLVASTTSDKDVPLILSVLSANIDYLIARNEQDCPFFEGLQDTRTPPVGSPNLLWHSHIQSSNLKLTLFHGLRAPNICVQKYLERIYKYTNCSPACFVVAYAYMDQLVHRQPDQPIISLNVHRLLITSVMLAAKTLDDVHFNNAFYARVGGVSVAELNRMELDLLFRLDFRLCVTPYTFESYCAHLEREFSNLGRKLCKGVPLLMKAEDMSNMKRPHATQGLAGASVVS